jgi:hypothetical protein
MSYAGDISKSLAAALSTGSLRNVEYGLRLRLEGAKRRGEETNVIEDKLEAARKELAKRLDVSAKARNIGSER